MSKVKMETCQFVRVTSLVPRSWRSWFYCRISENAPFSWGDNNRTLVTAKRFLEHCEDIYDDALEENVSEKEIQTFFNQLKELGQTYIDLEN